MRRILGIAGSLLVVTILLSCNTVGDATQRGSPDDAAAADKGAASAMDSMSKALGGDSGQPRGPKEPAYTGDGGKGITLAIFPTQTTGGDLGEDNWLVELIPGVLEKSFKEFSGIEILNRQDDETVRAEQQRALDGFVSDESGEDVAVGHELAAQYVLTSNIRKITNDNFLISMTITNTKTTEKIPYNNEGKDAAFEVRDASAIKKAALYLLEQMGVQLTEAGRRDLLGTSTEANINLARGREAQAQGRVIEAQSYFNNAISFDSSLAEATQRLKAVNEEVVNTVGGDIKNDVKSRELWKDYLDSFDKFYEEHPPFQLVYTQAVNTDKIDYDEQTYEIAISVGIRRTTLISAMQRNLDSINSDLEKTGNKAKWGFGNWPETSPIFSQPVEGYPDRIFQIKAAVLDADNPLAPPLAEIDFELPVKLILFKGKIYADAEKNLDLTFPRIHYNTSDDIPSNLLIKITEIDGMDGDWANADGYITLTSVGALPRTQGATYSRDLIAQMERETRLSQRQREEEQRKRLAEAERARREYEREDEEARRQAERDKEERRKQAWESDPWYNHRFGVNAEGGGYFGGGAWFMNFGLLIGTKSTYIELFVPIQMGVFNPALNTPSDASAAVAGFGFMWGYSFVGENLILTLGCGGSWLMGDDKPDEDSSSSYTSTTEDEGSRGVLSPFLKVQLDWIGEVFGLRVGYIADILPASLAEDFFYETKAVPLGDLKILDKFTIGLLMIY